MGLKFNRPALRVRAPKQNMKWIVDGIPEDVARKLVTDKVAEARKNGGFKCSVTGCAAKAKLGIVYIPGTTTGDKIDCTAVFACARHEDTVISYTEREKKNEASP